MHESRYAEYDGAIIGYKMHCALKAVGQSGAYSSKNELAICVGPHGSQNYGYRIVDRCLSKDLLELDPDHPNATPQSLGAVVLTDRGLGYLAEYTDLAVADSVTVTGGEA